jgi:hypothetical protein
MNIWFFIATLAASSALMATPSVLDDLNESQRQIVSTGGQVMLQEKIAGKPWPRARVFQRVKATPEELAAVFFDYANSTQHVPDLISSTISKKISPRVLEVDYVMNVPILPDEHYTARNELHVPTQGVYRFSWKLLRALQTKEAEGNLIIEPFPNGGSVIRYTNLVTPGSNMATLLRRFAFDRMSKTVTALVRYTENEKASAPAKMAAHISALQTALLGASFDETTPQKP